MSDVLIRGVAEEDLRRIDAEAERRGLFLPLAIRGAYLQ
jgi:hypothetical protein